MATATATAHADNKKAGKEEEDLKRRLLEIDEAYVGLSGDKETREESMIFLAKRIVDGKVEEVSRVRDHLRELLHNEDFMTVRKIRDMARKYEGSGFIPGKNVKHLNYKKYHGGVN